MPCNSCIPHYFRGPVVVMGVGCCFACLGAIPVSITMALGTKSSATIIGMGFVGFGMMLILPGLCWCILVNRRKYAFWRKRRRPDSSKQEETPALSALNQSMYGGTDDTEDCTEQPPTMVTDEKEEESNGIVINADCNSTEELQISVQS